MDSLNHWVQRSNDITELHNKSPSRPIPETARRQSNHPHKHLRHWGPKRRGGHPTKNTDYRKRPLYSPPPFHKRFSHANYHRHCFHHCYSRIFSHTQTYAPPHSALPAKVKTIKQPIDPRFFSFRRCSPFSDHPHH